MSSFSATFGDWPSSLLMPSPRGSYGDDVMDSYPIPQTSGREFPLLPLPPVEEVDTTLNPLPHSSSQNEGIHSPPLSDHLLFFDDWELDEQVWATRWMNDPTKVQPLGYVSTNAKAMRDTLDYEHAETLPVAMWEDRDLTIGQVWSQDISFNASLGAWNAYVTCHGEFNPDTPNNLPIFEAARGVVSPLTS
ncbi:hypothetical protein HYDPIDRAFT_191026 [Hydnomerulius pinastri MD-312]|uniref:Uncharacterized protein n=1 Tax=Hydnomerulius pinastri MD-312 TaxID=994086 RepID=A0A0C2PR83_9AGAM|nr:hypothetical protein HYDPIDRAFT_191026 [Hydnomerulius pinastri MD-312]